MYSSGDVTEEIKMSWVQLMVDSNVMKHFNIDDGMELEDGEELEENKHPSTALHCIAPPKVQMLHHTLSSDDDDDGMIFHLLFVYVLTLNRKPAPSAIPSDDEIVMWGHDDLISCRAVRPSLASGASSL